MADPSLSPTSTLVRASTSSSSLTFFEGAAGLESAPERLCQVGADIEKTLDADIGRATHHFHCGEYQDAVPHFERILQAHYDSPEINVAAMLLAKEDLAMCYSMLAMFDQSEALHREVLTQRLARIDRDGHPPLLRAYKMLGCCFQAQDRYAESEPLFQAALQGLILQHGEYHPEVLTIRCRLAMIRARTERYEESERMLEETIRSYSAYDSDHQFLWETHHSLAIVYSMQNRLDEAIPLFDWVWKKYSHQRGPGHPFCLEIIYNLASCLARQGRQEEARMLYRNVLDRRRHTIGEYHPWTLQTESALAMLAPTCSN
jgi:tetratricopeptide (TPR) repeat protein